MGQSAGFAAGLELSDSLLDKKRALVTGARFFFLIISLLTYSITSTLLIRIGSFGTSSWPATVVVACCSMV
jgi:hypothetical protein